MAKKRKLHGSVKKLIEPVLPSESEKAEIQIDEADVLYREIRIENVVTNDQGEKDKLKPGEGVDLIVETDPEKQKT